MAEDTGTLKEALEFLYGDAVSNANNNVKCKARLGTLNLWL